jgi:hypothetical protein
MKLSITHQESYSRGELLLRSFFGWLYIVIPHGFLLFFCGIWSAILAFITFWVVLFTGKFPEGIFDYQIKLYNWSLRFMATVYNLVDGYPAFGLSGTSDKVSLDVERPEKVNQGMVLVRALFGVIYVMIPHGFCLFFRMIGGSVLMFLAWWAVLFTGNYPEKWHAYQVGTFRWQVKINLYLGYFTDEYPSFTGKE